MIIKAPAAKAPKAAMMQSPNEKWNLDESKMSLVPYTRTPTMANPPAKQSKSRIQFDKLNKYDMYIVGKYVIWNLCTSFRNR